MASVRTYTLIYVALLALATGKVVLFELLPSSLYQVALGGTLVFAMIKILLIAGYFQHLRDEPRSISYMMGAAVFGVFLLTVAAGFSIQ